MSSNRNHVSFAPVGANKERDNMAAAYQVKLDRVLGLTVPSNAALDCDPESELIAYPAGCTVVLFNARKNRQTHLLNVSRKTITCLSYSADGRFLATGECGHLPAVRVWDLQDNSCVQVAELAGHKFAINCVAFSPSHKYVVSVGSQHDMIVNVWDWRAGVKVASNKVSARVKAVDFAENGSYFVTVGNRHVKFWYLEYTRSAKYKEPVPLMGRSAILGEQRNNYFCDVACGRGEMGDSTYAITKSGLLCEFNNRRLLDKWVELRTTSANCMVVGDHLIFIGCAEGIVRCFSPSTLQFVTTLPRTHYLGVDVAQGLSISHMASHPPTAKYPDAIALAFDPVHSKLTCVYNDHSLYVWDVQDIKRVGKAHSFLYHSACIWGVDMYPPMEGNSSRQQVMPPGSFVTCSSDDTIRVWNLDNQPTQGAESAYQRNIYSSDLLKVIYIDKELTYLKDLDLSSSGSEQKNDSSYDGRNGVRSIRISPDGQHLASGDRSGNIRVHELRRLQELCRIEAHDAEVLCLEYSRPSTGHRFLASASRDRLIHVFDVDEEYNFIQTLDDHSSSITAVRFLNSHDQLQMVSCGADKSIIFRQLQPVPAAPPQFSRGHNAAGKTTLYDMEVDSGQKHILTACQDRNIRVYNVSTGKHSKTFKGSVGEDGSLIKVVLDSSGIYAATSCTDKTLCIYDYYSGELMATMFGHSELVTGLRFSNDCRHLVSASGDGCLFVWKIPHDMVVTMHARLSQQAARAGKRPPAHITNGLHNLDNEEFGPPTGEFFDPNANRVHDDSYRFSVGQLPLWAKKQVAANGTAPLPRSTQGVDLPRGRWAQRIDPSSGITVKSVYDEDTVIPFPQLDKRVDSDGGGSKDSSIDSGTETLRQYPDIRRETMIISKQVSTGKITVTRGSRHHLTDDSSLSSYKYDDTNQDGDDESYSDERDGLQGQDIIYYPPAKETDSDFTVNAMDVEELRRSQRRSKKQRADRLVDVPHITVSTSVSGSQDSEDDDEDASTPSADTAERNLLSMLSVSTESLEQFGQRETYFKNTFESLSAAEQAERANKEAGGTSISAQFAQRQNGVPPARNMAVINATLQARTEGEQSRKREELLRRIEDTRRKLSSVGYRSNLKNSQSICDLSRVEDRHGLASHAAHRYTSQGADSDDDDGETEGGGLRRACSLSDLVNPSPRRNAPIQVSGKVSKPSAPNRLSARHGPKSHNITRSTSMVLLNQSDSESDLSVAPRPRVNGLMRPTISSQNKVNAAKGGSTSRRRGMSQAYSSVNLSSVGNEDSSSEETGRPKARPRSASIDRSPSSLPSAPQPRPRANARNAGGRPNARHSTLDPDASLDVASAPLNVQLCNSVADQLTRTADSVVQLYKRLANEEQQDSNTMLTHLQEAVSEAQRTLRLVANPSHANADDKILPPATQPSSAPPPDQSVMAAMMQQYSDILLNMVQQRIAKPDPS